MKGNRFIWASRIRVELIRRSIRHIVVCKVQRCLVMVGYRPGLSRCPRMTPDHHHPWCKLVHHHRNWNHQHWSHVIFADKSRVKLYHSNLLFLVCNNPLTFQQHDKTFGQGHYMFYGLPWCGQQMSDDTSEDGSSLGPVWQHAAALTTLTMTRS